MEKYFLPAITLLYSLGGIVTFAGFFPTMRDLWKKKPSANIWTYIIWAVTTFLTLLYAAFVVKDLVFSIVISLQLAACLVILVLRMRLKYSK